MKNKIIVALLLSVILVLGAVSPAFAAQPGVWKVNTKAGSYLTSGEKALFKKAIKTLTGASYTPVFRLAKQTVSGTNYAFLCTSSTATASPVNAWKVVLVNKSPKGKCKALKIRNFTITKLKTRSSAYRQPSGDGVWTYNSKAVSSKGVPSAANKAFKKAAKDYAGVSLTPLALLGTQVVSGTNYKFLCRGVATTANSTVCLYDVNVYKNTKGVCKITDCNVINLPAYLKY